MSKQAMITYYFPEEILIKIFLNLSIKSLGKCMCVCKTWNCLIKEPSFISSHFNEQSENSTRKLFLPQNLWLGEPCNLHFDDQEFSKYTQLQLGPLYNNHPRKIEVAGSCNGLILLVEDYTSENSKIICKFILCNPTIRKYVRLPPPCLSCTPFNISGFGIGFELTRNDYKVLKISHIDEYDYNHVGFELYSHKENSWKILASPKYYNFPYAPLVSVNGVVHWIGRCAYSEIKYMLMAFDMGDEVYKEIMLPESMRISRNWKSVFQYDKLSSIAVSIYEYECSEFNIWVMKEYGVIETWTKMFTFRTTEPHPDRSLWVKGLRKNGGLILNPFKDWEMVSHDVESSGDKNLVLKEKFDCIFSYVESLVLVNARSDNGANNVISYAAGYEDEATNDSRRKEGEEPIK